MIDKIIKNKIQIKYLNKNKKIRIIKIKNKYI